MVENNDLRESLQSMQTELINLLNHHDEDQSEHTDNEAEVCFVSPLVVNCKWQADLSMGINASEVIVMNRMQKMAAN